MKHKNILITGGLGFIGSHIADKLIADNNITIIDDQSTGCLKNLKTPNHENLKIINQDICNADFDELTSNIDYIFHLAAMANVPLSTKYPIKCSEINLNSTIKLLKSAANNNVKKVIFSSSSSVYGTNENMPLKESEELRPTSPYAASKASCELYLKSFYESYDLNYTSLRYFNVFGPRQSLNSEYASVIPNFINAILTNTQPVIYGDGKQTRDFIYIDSVVEANIAASKSDYNGIVNVASGVNISINELYELIRQLLKSDLKPKYLPKRPGDIKHSHADITNISKINMEIKQNNFKKEIEKTINWFKTNM
ncbi:MAG: NAD-dependent epimerase/dehydratase family protein [Methanobrevibacter sp.]|nr:NAD-dependent epimerase/dehydratase family protein [Methanobrevibacter sp.]